MKMRVALAVILVLLMATSAFAEKMSVAVGEEFEISLKGNPTTGFEWRVGTLPSFLEAIGAPLYISDNTGGMPVSGTGGTYYFKFRAKEKGDGELVLEYLRDWENRPPLEVKKVRVIAK